MKQALFILGALYCLWLPAQPNTEIYLVDLELQRESMLLKNPVNISQNEGYDNQPFFYDDATVLYSATRNGQTDIRKYTIANGQSEWLTATPVGSEYSPTRIPGSEDISAIRLDTTGLQRLYRYNITSGASKTILEDAKVGYHLWVSADHLVTTVLTENRMDLVVSRLKEGSNYTYQKQVGRSLLQIPLTNRISFLDVSQSKHQLKSMDPVSGATSPIVAVEGSQDFCWLPDGSLITAKGNSILRYRQGIDTTWQKVQEFQEVGLQSITRIASNPSGTQLALVATISPENFVQKQVNSYNARDLDGFVASYTEDVAVREFPSEPWYVGREEMRKRYRNNFDERDTHSVTVEQRIVIGNTVIDEETAMDNGEKTHQVAIYQVGSNGIETMTFIFEKDTDDPVPIVQKQLDAYNARDIDAFMATYSDDVQLFTYPNSKFREGQEKMRDGYQEFFEATPDLHCEIKKRIVIGNKVIDEEYVTANGVAFSAVAIYEVEDGKIAKVTFIQ